MKTRKSKEDQVVPLGNCFICLNPCSKSKTVDDKSHSAFRLLCHHLDIKVNTEVKAIMCEKCDKTLGMISEHVLLMEVCQMKVNSWLGQVQTSISKTNKSFRIYDEGYEVVGLREAILEKCRLRTSNLLPRVTLSRVEPSLPSTLIKTEEEDETYLTNNHFVNGFEDNEDKLPISSSSSHLPFEGDDSSVSFPDEDTTEELQPSSGASKRRTRHTCQTCGKSLADKRTLQKHIKYVHNTIPNHKCGACGKLFKIPEALQRHKTTCQLKLLSNADFKYACKLCDRRYKEYKAFSYHKLYFHSDIRKHKCDMCSLSFKLSTLLINHKRTVHDKIKYPCELKGCRKSFRRISTKWAHMMKEHNLHGPPTPTEFQLKGVPAVPSKYAEHFTKKTAENGKIVFQCNHCGDKRYKQFSAFTTHYKDIHVQANGQSSTCHICGKIKANDKALNLHIKRAHQTERNIQCDLCGKLFKEARNMHIHKETCSPKPAPNPDYKHACDLCDSRFKIAWRLSLHKQHVHSDVRNYKCGICSKSFKSSTQLSGHKRDVHDKLRRRTFPCEIEGCSKSFHGNPAKWVHMNKEHTFHGPPPPKGHKSVVPTSAFAEHCTKTFTLEGKRYYCNYCKDTTFQTLSGFVAHYKTVHIENRLIVKKQNYTGHYTIMKGDKGQEIINCEYCDKEYKNVNCFRKHYKIVHLKLTFQCETCGVSKDSESRLKHHIAKEHAVN